MKILEICNYSSGISGVWSRVFEESKMLSEAGHDVHVFSSNLDAQGKTLDKNHEINGIKIRRFNSKLKIGYALFFNFKKELEKLKPDAVIVHGYRKPYLNQAIKYCEKNNKKCYLVTHAPFLEKGIRSFYLDNFINLYDRLIGKEAIKRFDKVFAITEWELPHLANLGLPREKIKIIPNGIPSKFFTNKKSEKIKNKIVFLGGINKIKNLEILIDALSRINKKYLLEIIGDGQEEYITYLRRLAQEKKVKINFTGPIYDLNGKIKKLDSAKIFVLPSKREAMPQALVEAMSRELIVISSDNKGSSEIISDEKNGFLFKNNNAEDLAHKIDTALSDNKNLRKISIQARKDVEKFNWERISNKILTILEDKNT